MKKVILLSLITAICTLRAIASDDNRYVKAMESALAFLHNSKSVDEMQQAANQLERIATAETKQWLPAYWAAYCYINMAFMENATVRKDQLLDQADKFLQKAEAIAPENDEVLVLKAFVAQARISIDGQARYPKYAPVFNESLRKARQINPDNPRVDVLEGQMLYHTPEAFGGGKAIACPKLKQAIDKFAAFKMASAIHPDWGIKSAQQLYAQCGN